MEQVYAEGEVTINMYVTGWGNGSVPTLSPTVNPRNGGIYTSSAHREIKLDTCQMSLYLVTPALVTRDAGAATK